MANGGLFSASAILRLRALGNQSNMSEGAGPSGSEDAPQSRRLRRTLMSSSGIQLDELLGASYAMGETMVDEVRQMPD